MDEQRLPSQRFLLVSPRRCSRLKWLDEMLCVTFNVPCMILWRGVCLPHRKASSLNVRMTRYSASQKQRGPAERDLL